MNRLTREHIPWIKKLLAQKSNMDLREQGHEIVFEQAVLDVMRKHGYTLVNVHQFICDFPIVGLTPLNKQCSRYLVEISGTHGGKQVRIKLEMVVDQSGLDFKAKDLIVRR